MIKLLATCLWISLATLASGYGVVVFKGGNGAVKDKNEFFGGLDYVKTEVFSVPIIANSKIEGYIVLKLVFIIDGNLMRQLKVPMDAFVIDRAFSVIYSDDTIKIKTLEKPDVAKLMKKVRLAINKKFKSELINDVLIEQFNIIKK